MNSNNHYTFLKKRVSTLNSATVQAVTLLVAMGCGLVLTDTSRADEVASPVHGIAMLGQPAQPADFRHLTYANPDAPKGGTLRLSQIGSFDTLNPFTVKGRPAANLQGLVYQSLLGRAYDEPFSLYGLVASSVTLPKSRRWVSFQINPLAKFSDGKPITASDIEFSMITLRDHGRPNFKNLYQKVSKVTILSTREIRFDMSEDAGREAPLLLGLMPILPKHHTNVETFGNTTLELPTGSGPYVVKELEVGRRIVYERNPHYWADEVASVRGLYNFHRFVYDYFRDTTSAREAFKSGEIDVWPLPTPQDVQQMERFVQANPRKFDLAKFEYRVPAGMDALVMNSRRKPFNSKPVRTAMRLLFDYPAVNRLLYHNQYSVTRSYWDRSELSSCGQAASAIEKKWLSAFPDAASEAAISGECINSQNKSARSSRQNRRKAYQLLKAEGYNLRNGKWIHSATNHEIGFEIIYRSNFEARYLSLFADSLKKNGISVSLRRLDSAQFQQRRNDFDFDMMPNRWFASLSPGVEQFAYWGSDSANVPGTRNYMGVREQAVDFVIEQMLQAKNTETFKAGVRALDRILISGEWVIPLFHGSAASIAHSKRLGIPSRGTNYGYFVESWWENTR